MPLPVNQKLGKLAGELGSFFQIHQTEGLEQRPVELRVERYYGAPFLQNQRCRNEDGICVSGGTVLFGHGDAARVDQTRPDTFQNPQIDEHVQSRPSVRGEFRAGESNGPDFPASQIFQPESCRAGRKPHGQDACGIDLCRPRDDQVLLEEFVDVSGISSGENIERGTFLDLPGELRGRSEAKDGSNPGSAEKGCGEQRGDGRQIRRCGNTKFGQLSRSGSCGEWEQSAKDASPTNSEWPECCEPRHVAQGELTGRLSRRPLADREGVWPGGTRAGVWVWGQGTPATARVRMTEVRNLFRFQCDNTSMRYWPIRVVFCVCVAASALLAQQALSLDKLLEFVKSSIAQKLPDKEVAAYLATVRVTSKLEDRVVEDMQGLGAGPKTIAALNRLVEQTAKLAMAAPKPPAPKYIEPPPPSAAEQKRVLAEVREYALNYTKTLPDFICLQLTRRSVDMRYEPGTLGSWTPADRIVEKLSYFDSHEKYEAITVNDTPMYGKTWENLGGSISRGEFGSLLRDVFEEGTAADFEWDHWGTLRKKLCYVFRYRISASRSHYSVDFERKQQAVPGYHGLVYVEKGSNVITRLTIEPEMPAGFPVQEIHQQIDYDHVEISGNKFLLPMYSQVQSRAGRFGSRNEIEFRKYQKYAADTSIKFDDVEEPPIPEDQKKEQPVKP